MAELRVEAEKLSREALELDVAIQRAAAAAAELAHRQKSLNSAVLVVLDELDRLDPKHAAGKRRV